MNFARESAPRFAIDDYSESPFYSLLKKLPSQLAANHIRYIESQGLSDTEAVEYLTDIVGARQEVLTSTVISDKNIETLLGDRVEETMKALETTVFNSPDNYLGQGMTAKVKLFELHNQDTESSLPIAVKYVVTPTEKTITAEQEHNVIKEVERLRHIESLELAFPNRSQYIRVPHPYFHHTNDKMQLYGMEVVNGVTFEQILTEGMLHKEFKERLLQTPLLSLDPKELDGFVERFFVTMHTYCLHGDIKPRNLMLGENGIIYVIDFGQSILVHNVPGGAEAQLDNLMSDEITSTKSIVRMALGRIQSAD